MQTLQNLLFLALFVPGCSSILQSIDSGGTELVPGTFYHEPLKVTTRYSTNSYTDSGYGYDLSHSYCFSIDRPRFIRYIHIDTLGEPVRNVHIYTRLANTDSWELVKQLKSPIDTSTRINLNVRASEIRAIQKTVSLRREADDIIIGFKVYAQVQ